MPPKVYAEYHTVEKKEETSKSNVFTLLKFAPSTFWKVGLVQFFSWFAFMYMWTYTNGTVAANCWGVDMLAHDATRQRVIRKQATGRYSLCHSGDWFGGLGNGSSTVQEHQTRILLLTYLRRSRLCPRSLIHNQYVMFIHSSSSDVPGQPYWQCHLPW